MKLKTEEMQKLLNAYNAGKTFTTSMEVFEDHCRRYIKAIDHTRMICDIDAVSRSGMSRTLKFVEMQKRTGSKQHNLLNFYELFCILEYSPVKQSDYFRIYGCGMDMVFATNYNIIHQLHQLGFITRKRCDRLAQDTPRVI